MYMRNCVSLTYEGRKGTFAPESTREATLVHPDCGARNWIMGWGEGDELSLRTSVALFSGRLPDVPSFLPSLYPPPEIPP